MFDPRLYRNACSELRPSEEKIEEMIAMTANHEPKKKIRHPLRMGAVIAATMALLTIGASAASCVGRSLWTSGFSRPLEIWSEAVMSRASNTTIRTTREGALLRRIK